MATMTLEELVLKHPDADIHLKVLPGSEPGTWRIVAFSHLSDETKGVTLIDGIK